MIVFVKSFSCCLVIAFIFIMLTSAVRSFSQRAPLLLRASFSKHLSYSSSICLFSRRKPSEHDNVHSIDDLVPKDEPGWVSVKFNDDEIVQRVDMMDRIEEAKRVASSLESQAKKNNPALFKTNSKGKERISTNQVDEYLGKGNDSKKRLNGYLDLNPFVCSGCGTNFQSKTPDAPGFLPREKFKEHQEKAEFIRLKQEAIKTLTMAGLELNSPAAAEMLRVAEVSEKIIESIKEFGDSLDRNAPREEIIEGFEKESLNSLPDPSANELSDFLINSPSTGGKMTKFPIPENVKLDQMTLANMLSPRSRSKLLNGMNSTHNNLKSRIDTKTAHDPMDKSSEEDVCICQRCFRLQQYGQVEQNLRPGWSNHELLTPERFEDLLASIKKNEAVVLCLVDIFDLQGSIVRNLKSIVGNNPLLIGVNKVDLLPKDISSIRIKRWVHEEVKRICGFVSPNEDEDEDAIVGLSTRNVLKLSNIHLISCKKEAGVKDLMNTALSMAEANGRKIYVMGAANVGKSSFINHLLDPSQPHQYGDGQYDRFSQKNKKKAPMVTVSNLPGTTLDFLKIKLPNSGITIVDTPGLINKGHLTSKLNTDELKQVIPSKPINAVTFRLEEGKCVLVGGLARLELMEGKPFFFTFYVSNEVKLHLTDHTRADDFLASHIGKLIFPPASKERFDELGPFVETIVELEGDSWKSAAADIVIPGLGWVTMTGPGLAKLRITTMERTEVSIRPPLLPFEARHTTASFTGGRIHKKSRKIGVKSYGWRA